MTVAEVVDDLLELEDLGRRVGDRERRRLDEVRVHMAKRERGAKVSEAAAVLGVSQPRASERGSTTTCCRPSPTQSPSGWTSWPWPI